MLWFLFSCSQPVTLQDSLHFYESQPVHLRPQPLSEVPEGLPDMRAETCGQCHQEIYEEWKISTHAKAWDKDPQFQAELHKPRPQGSNVQWMCINCHTPLIQQQESVVVSLDGGLDRPKTIENPLYDKKLQEEGVTCAACHVKDGVILGTSDIANAPHPVQKSQALTSSSLCLDCHQAVDHFEDVNLACFFNTGNEHALGPYSDQTCQSCHMPNSDRITGTGLNKKTERRHYFGGSLIPKKVEYQEEMKEMSQYFMHGLAVKPLSLKQHKDRIKFSLRFSNARAGHYIPSGDPERFLLFTLRVLDQDDKTVFASEYKIESQYKWWPSVELINDNRLAPKEERVWESEWKDPNLGEYKVEVLVEKWRISKENLEYHDLQSTVPSHIEIWKQQTPISIVEINDEK